MKDSSFYENKIILAPMVRIGTLPMRLLALDYGADIVYTEELIDFKLLRSVRQENDILGTIDYVDKTDGTIIFRTSPREKSKVVLQLGTSDPSRALEVGKLIENDVAAIDINMGCPKKFSLLGGMGAALLKNSERAQEILKILVDNLSIPVTCKIRVFNDIEKTYELVDKLVSTGISAIGIHGRTPDERPQHNNRNEYLKKIAERINIPVIANGGSKDIEKYNDIGKFKKSTGCTSVMIARAAQWNCSIFRKQGLLPIDDIVRAYLKYSVDYNNPPANTKYCVQNIIRELQETPMGKVFLAAQTLEQICDVWDLADYCREKTLEYQKAGLQGRFQVIPISRKENNENNGKRKFDDDDDIVELKCAFMRNAYTTDGDLPKTKLLNWLRDKKNLKAPLYKTWCEDKLFRSIVTVEGRKYSSTFWEKSKKWAEQGAAIVCLYSFGLITDETLVKSGSILG